MPSLREHEDDYANFFMALGLARRAARDLAEMLCRAAEVIDAMEEMSEQLRCNEADKVDGRPV